jgi:multidrug resistance protein, MATE family
MSSMNSDQQPQIAPENQPGTARRTRERSEYIDDPGKKRVMGFEPILAKRIMHLGLPVIIGMLTQTAINMIDSAMVGRLREDMAVAGTAALGPSLVLLWAFGGFLSAISVGTQALTARRYGEGSARGAGRVLTNSAILALSSSILVSVLAWFLAKPIFHAISHDPLIRDVGTSYARIRFIGLFSMVLMMSYKSFYDGVGRVRIHMSIAIIMNLSNALLNYILIFGKWGFPAMEVDGAAWASVISSSGGLAIMILWSMRRKDWRTFRVYQLRNINLSVMGRVAYLSIWSGLATLFVMTGFGFFYWIVGRVDKMEGLAGVNTAATSAVINISMLCFMTCIAFGTATATLVSQSMGARKPDLAERYGWQSIKIIVLLMGVLGGTAVLFSTEIVRLFLPETGGFAEVLKDQVVQIAGRSLSLAGFGAPIAAAALVFTQALYGAGESRYVMIVELVLHFSCLVPLAYGLAVVLGFGLNGCWYAAGIYGFALMTAMGSKFYLGGWKKTEI